MTKILSLTTAAIVTLASATTAISDTVTLTITTASATGVVRAAAYASAQAFEKGDIAAAADRPAQSGTTQLEIKPPHSGTFGIALFHDVNGNEKLDTNLLGAPNEPFGFSNNPIIKFSAPKFEEFMFEFDGTPMTLNITLNGG